MRIERHPGVNFRREQQNREEQDRQPGKQQRTEVFAEAADADRPAGVGQVMHHHQEQAAQRDAQVKHERQQPGIAEFRRAFHQADDRKHRADDQQNAGQLPPTGQIQRRQLVRFV